MRDGYDDTVWKEGMGKQNAEKERDFACVEIKRIMMSEENRNKGQHYELL